MSETREELKKIMAKEGLSLADLARATNYSKSGFSQWLGGTYPGDGLRIEEAARRYVEVYKARESAAGTPLPFTLTSAAARIFEVLDLSHVDQELSVIYGEAGTGKSVAVREYARRNPEAILIETNLSYTPKNLLQEININLGLTTVGHLYTLFNEALSKIKNSGRLLIIDEAENLPYASLEILRRLHDRAGIGICLVGMPKLIHNMRGKAGEYKQLYSRVGYITKIEGLREDDAGLIVTLYRIVSGVDTQIAQYIFSTPLATPGFMAVSIRDLSPGTGSRSYRVNMGNNPGAAFRRMTITEHRNG